MKRIAARHGREISEISVFAGADVFANKGDENAKTIAQQYEPLGVNMVPAPMDRISGWGEMLDLLGDPTREENPIPARLRITRDSVKLIECIPALQHNPNKPEDVLKWDVDEEGTGGDDPADAARYGLMARLIDPEDAPAVGGTRNPLIVR
jgi:hypothetical protein